MDASVPHPRVGVAAIISNKDGRVVLGRRKAGLGTGEWGFPGGRLEYGEEILDCAQRETLEETGLRVQAVKIAALTNTIFAEEGQHYITIYVVCQRQDENQEPELLEPDRCEGWEWTSWDEIKKMADRTSHENLLFAPIERLVKQYEDPESLVSSCLSVSVASSCGRGNGSL